MELPVAPTELSATILAAVERAGLGLTIVRVRGGHLERVYSNPAFCQLTGYSAAELAAIAPIAMVPPDEAARLRAMLQQFQADGQHPPTIESRLIVRSGEVVPVEVSMASVPHGDSAYTVSFVRDIRERDAAARALRESELRFRTLAEASAESITVIADRRFVYANPAAARLLGFDSPAELMARPLDQLLLDPAEIREMMMRVGRVLAGEALPPREYRGRHKDGSAVVMEISTSRVSFDGRPATLSFGRDTSERRAWEAELLRSDRLAALGLLAASVAHEINNPLTYLHLHLDRLRELVPGAVADAEVRRRLEDHLAAARDGAERVRTIVRELLSVARHDHEASLVAVGEVLDTALRLAGPTLRERAEVVRRGGEVPPVRANPGRLSQVFVNLALNAADAFDAPSPDNRVEIAIAHEGDQVVVTVADNGRGIASEDLERVFEPLFTTKLAGQSTGLGLSICRGIVAELGGSITAASQPGGGTRMTVRLPAATATSLAPPAAAPAAATPRRRIAVIDDDVLVARSLATLIDQAHEVETFTSPRAALAALVDGPAFDHVLCDVNMPGLSGPELYERLCERRPEYTHRFTLITGGASTPRIDAMIEDGRLQLLRKPCDPGTILAAVSRAA